MVSIFQKIGLLFVCLIAFAVEGNGQVLVTANLNLSTGGYINDVVYDPYHDCYIVVGNFTTINSIARKNIAFINASNLTVNTDPYLAPLTNIDGEIRCVEITTTSTVNYQYYHLYIGGNFSTINGTQTRLGIAKFTGSITLFLPIAKTNFALSSWNPDLDIDPLFYGVGSEGVEDILISGDTLFFCGNFLDYYTDIFNCLATYSVASGVPHDYAAANDGSITWPTQLFKMAKKGDYLYVAGSDYQYRLPVFLKLDTNGVVPGFNYTSSQLTGICDFYFIEDSLMVVLESDHGTFDGPDHMTICRQW